MDFGDLSLPQRGHTRPLVQVSLEKPLGFQARQERQTQGSSLPLFKREKACPSAELSSLSPAIVPSIENLSLGDRQRLWAPRCPHSGLFVGRERQWAACQPLGCCRSGPMLPGLRFGISSPLRMVMPGWGKGTWGVAALPPSPPRRSSVQPLCSPLTLGSQAGLSGAARAPGETGRRG